MRIDFDTDPDTASAAAKYFDAWDVPNNRAIRDCVYACEETGLAVVLERGPAGNFFTDPDRPDRLKTRSFTTTLAFRPRGGFAPLEPELRDAVALGMFADLRKGRWDALTDAERDRVRHARRVLGVGLEPQGGGGWHLRVAGSVARYVNDAEYAHFKAGGGRMWNG